MRVAFVVPGGLDRISGGFLYDRHLIAALRAGGVTVDVVPLPWLASTLALALAANLTPLARALDDRSADRYDVVIEDELAHPSLLRANRRLRARGARVIALVHNLACRQPSTPRRWARAIVERQYLRGVDGVAAVCASTWDDVRALLGDHHLPAAMVVPAGREPSAAVTPAAVQQRAMQPGPLRILFVATVTPAKGLHRLLDTLGALDAAGLDATVDVAGAFDHDVGYKRALRRRVADAGWGDRVRLHGLLRGEPLWALYRQAHVLALPSDREAYPLVAVEALAAGLPVLVTDAGGAREVVGQGAHAYCLPPDDPVAWAAALAAFARDRPRLAAAGLAALHRFAALPTWADTASGIRTLCRRLGVDG